MLLKQLTIGKGKNKFSYFDTKGIDDKYRINIGRIFRRLFSQNYVDEFAIYVNKEGYLLLQPVVKVPANEQWVHENPEILASIQKGIEDIKEGRITKVKDIEKYIESI